MDEEKMEKTGERTGIGLCTRIARFTKDTHRISTRFFFGVKNMSRCIKYHKPGQGVGVGFCHICHSVKICQKHLGLLESSRGPPDHVQIDTCLVSDLRSHIPMGTLCN